MIIVLVGSIVGPVLQGGALSLLLFYAQALEADRAIAYLGSARSPEVFVAVVTTAGLLLIGAAGVTFVSDKVSIVLSRILGKSASRRLMIGDNPFAGRGSAIPRDGIPRNLIGTARECIIILAISSRALLHLIPTFLLGSYAAGLMFVLAPFVTLTLAGLALPLGFVYHRISYDVVQNEHRLRAIRRTATADVLSLFRRFGTVTHWDSTNDRELKEMFEERGLAGMADAIGERQLGIARADGTSNLMIALVVVGVFVVLGLEALSGTMAWSSFIAYLIAMRISLTSARGILKTATSFARHYPAIREYRRTVGRTSGGTSASLPKTVTLTAGNDELAPISVSTGEWLGVVGAPELTRYSAHRVTDMLAYAAGPTFAAQDYHSYAIPRDPKPPLDAQACRLLRLPPFVTPGRLVEQVGSCCQAIDIAEWFVDLNAPLPKKVADSLNRAALTELSLIAAWYGTEPAVIIAAPAFGSLSPDAQASWRDMFKERYAVIYYEASENTPWCRFGESAIAILGSEERQPIGVASAAWYADHKAEFESIAKKRLAQSLDTDDSLADIEDE